MQGKETAAVRPRFPLEWTRRSSCLPVLGSGLPVERVLPLLLLGGLALFAALVVRGPVLGSGAVLEGIAADAVAGLVSGGGGVHQRCHRPRHFELQLAVLVALVGERLAAHPP